MIRSIKNILSFHILFLPWHVCLPHVSSQLVQLTEKYQPSLFDAWYKSSYFVDTSNMTTKRISFPLVAEHFITLRLEV